MNPSAYLLKKIRDYASLPNRVRVNSELFLAMRRISVEQDRAFPAMHLASGREIRYPEMSSFGELFLNGLVAEHGIIGLGTRPSFQAHPDREFSLRHYGPGGAAVVAEAVSEAIKQQPACRRYVTCQ